MQVGSVEQSETLSSDRAHGLGAESLLAAMIEVVENIFRTMLQADVARATEQRMRLSDAMTAAVDFDGSLEGRLSLQCSTNLARWLVNLFMGDEQDADATEVRSDVLRELANIIEGNLKMVMPAGTQVTPACIAATSPSAVEMDGVLDIETLFVLNHEILSVRFAQHACEKLRDRTLP